MANAEIRSHDEYLSPVSLNLRRGTAELQLQQTQPISQASGGPQNDDRRYVAAKLVNIAQCLDRPISKAGDNAGHASHGTSQPQPFPLPRSEVCMTTARCRQNWNFGRLVVENDIRLAAAWQRL